MRQLRGRILAFEVDDELGFAVVLRELADWLDENEHLAPDVVAIGFDADQDGLTMVATVHDLEANAPAL